MAKYLSDYEQHKQDLLNSIYNFPDPNASGGSPAQPATGTTNAIPAGYYPEGIAYPTPAAAYSSAYGGQPFVPSYGVSAAKATQANVANLPGTFDLASATNAFNLGEQTKQYTAGIPGYQGLVDQSGRNISYLLGGGDNREAFQTAAEKNIAAGVAGSAFGGNQVLKDIESDRIKKMMQGEELFTGAVNRMPRTALYSPSSMNVTPEQQYQSQLLANIYASSPVPEASAAAGRQAATSGVAAGYGAAARNVGGGYGGGSDSSANIASILQKYLGGGTGGSSSYVPQAAVSPTVTTNNYKYNEPPSDLGGSANYDYDYLGALNLGSPFEDYYTPDYPQYWPEG
jgi:hypothetical protein